MSTHRKHLRHGVAFASVAALGLTLAACSSDDGSGSGEESSAEGGDKGTITLGYIPAWTDGLSTAYLLDAKLTEAGYTVEHQEISEAGVLYTALADGDVDIYPSAWPEVTHADYMEQYEGSIEDLSTYYDNAKLTFAVPEYTDIDSIDELADNADMFDSTIVGIEPGAGLTRVTKESVIPTYGLDEAGYTLQESSTTAMLTELEQATENEEDIVVTLWRPFWANSAYPVKDLEDPEGALGDSEGLHFLATEGFSDEYPEVADWIGGMTLDDEQFGTLENSVVNDNPDDPAAGVEAWLEENGDAVGSIDS
ncbi:MULTISPECIES: glycine betaine ABC transporter substrate-binding protein [Isoptericola]|uniref:Glycine betaine ABC transporter substrate-binding protein n=1 Tax=Isoptericola sediminis TaxID=2733572 RepID=A0A849K624_9MICO|nr:MULTISPECIES: glycine betaine ABC transporter substrate-binding protein [Isoptericola]MDO8144153.1 glycine betaine ABC transporter substrate-binding protein [Isoptericola sp. 178]MDO8148006.1 glycine betaine ABC transporter substrate-binding protein [Isoptericola sp. b515]MDO8151482.1 glycine betaine ABC transporter substrate-binding protein [Isoptericola sp. b408]NNU27880.1 glycine betaine ABC transporter substrate-binding protein [Isoptericola sediminis]